MSKDENTFRVGCDTYLAQKGNGYSDCDLCVFGNMNCMAMKNRPPCNKEERADRREVYYVLFKGY
jgi:hypothetical protein